MDDKVKRRIDVIQDGVEEPVYCPNPNDFTLFLPWACKEYCVEADVIVNRGLRAVSFNTTTDNTNKKRGQKRKQSKNASLITPQDPTSTEESTSETKSTPGITHKIVNVDTVYDSNENLVELKFLKNKEIPRKVIQILALIFPFHQQLTAITINSGLRMDSLYELSKCLPISQINELCLDGTSIIQANYDILLTQRSNLKHLSLARCSLNDSVVKRIADQLKEPCPAAKVLSALNLSTNRITDIGAEHLADMLRTNRQLSYLNLADNMITDEGGVIILNTLQKFPLRPQELLESRTRYVAHLKKRNDLVRSFKSDLQTNAIAKNYKKKTKKRSKIESQPIQQHFESADTKVTEERAEFLADSQLGTLNEPFSPSNTKIYDGVLHCLGNYNLCYLNLAYNSLTFDSVKKLLEVLTTQKSHKQSQIPRGLVKVVLAGNPMPASSEEFEEIESLLGSVTDSFGKLSSNASKKRPLSTRSVVR